VRRNWAIIKDGTKRASSIRGGEGGGGHALRAGRRRLRIRVRKLRRGGRGGGRAWGQVVRGEDATEGDM
jgi:hypothetical protein